MLTVALIYASLSASLVIADCSIPPIYLDVHAREVEGTDNAVSYGAYINIGSPVQQLSLWPSLEINETTLADVNFCSSSSCSASSAHGLFDPAKSSSFQNAPPTQLDNASLLTGSVSTIAQTGTDVLHLWEDLMVDDTAETNISSFPLQLLSNYTSSTDPFFGPAGLVGLGPSSTVLDYLQKAGQIASRSYGLFLGTAYPRASGTNSVNGSVTLGGYDAARFQAPVQSFALAPSDTAGGALRVPVSAMTLSSSSGNLVHAHPFTASLSTAQYELTLPASLAASLPSSVDPAADLTLTITLGDNFTVSFDAAWLSTHPFAFSSSDTGPYVLGASFLASTYLSVSYDSTPPAFFLAPALPQAAYVNPRALCANAVPLPQGSAHVSFFVKNGLVGLIVGGSIGGGALTVLGIVVFGGWRREGRSKEDVLEMGDWREEGKGVKGSQRRGGEKAEKGRSAAWDAEVMYFEAPPKRATVVVDRERKMGLKGILKVKVPEKQGRK